MNKRRCDGPHAIWRGAVVSTSVHKVFLPPSRKDVGTQFHAFYVFLMSLRAGGHGNSMMRLKSVAWVAMVGMAYWCVVSLLFDAGLLEDGCDVIRIGWENEYGESGMVSLDKLKWLLSIPYEICCLFFCAFRPLRRMESGNRRRITWISHGNVSDMRHATAMAQGRQKCTNGTLSWRKRKKWA